jgi:hypothetical protein
MSIKPIQFQARLSIPEFFRQLGIEASPPGKPEISFMRAYLAFDFNKYPSQCFAAPFLNSFGGCFDHKTLSEHLLVGGIITSHPTAAWLNSTEIVF